MTHIPLPFSLSSRGSVSSQRRCDTSVQGWRQGICCRAGTHTSCLCSSHPPHLCTGSERAHWPTCEGGRGGRGKEGKRGRKIRRGPLSRSYHCEEGVIRVCGVLHYILGTKNHTRNQERQREKSVGHKPRTRVDGQFSCWSSR